MKARIRLFAFHPIWIVMVVGGLHVKSDLAYAQHKIFDTEVIEKWKAYESFSHGLQGTERSERIANGEPRESILRIKQNRECALIIEPYNRDPSLLSCTLVNPHYRATITLSKSDPPNVVLQKYTPLPSDSENLSPFDIVYMRASRHFYYAGATRLRQAVSDPSFIVTKVAKEIQNGRELVRVDHSYNYVSRMGSRESHARAHGTLWFDPSRYWCIHRSKTSTEITTGDERRAEIARELVCETIDHPSGFPILKSVTERVNTNNYKSNKRLDVTTKSDYDLEVNDNVPDSDFTLSAFGLPERSANERVSKRHLWIFVAAGVCL